MCCVVPAEDGYVYDNIQLMDEPAFPFQAGVDNFIKNLVQKVRALPPCETTPAATGCACGPT